jgi:predicted PurR-regulated permease PerM
MEIIQYDCVPEIRELRETTPQMQLSIGELNLILAERRLTSMDKTIWLAISGLAQAHPQLYCEVVLVDLVTSVASCSSVTYLALLKLLDLGFLELDIDELNNALPTYLGMEAQRRSSKIERIDKTMGVFLQKRYTNSFVCRLVLPKKSIVCEPVKNEIVYTAPDQPVMVNLLRNRVGAEL